MTTLMKAMFLKNDTIKKKKFSRKWVWVIKII